MLVELKGVLDFMLDIRNSDAKTGRFKSCSANIAESSGIQ